MVSFFGDEVPLPPDLRRKRSRALSSAYLAASEEAYRHLNLDEVRRYLWTALRLYPMHLPFGRVYPPAMIGALFGIRVARGLRTAKAMVASAKPNATDMTIK